MRNLTTYAVTLSANREDWFARRGDHSALLSFRWNQDVAAWLLFHVDICVPEPTRCIDVPFDSVPHTIKTVIDGTLHLAWPPAAQIRATYATLIPDADRVCTPVMEGDADE